MINITVGSKPGFKYISSSDYTNPTNVNFSSYEDFDLGIQLQYPSNWEKTTVEGGSITFRSMPEDISDTTREYVKLYVYPISNKTLDEEIAINEPLQNLTIIQPPHNTSLANNHARMIVYSYTDNRYGMIKAMKIATQQNDNVYILTYFAQESKYNDYFPTIQKMIDSFNILKIIQYTSFNLGMRMEYLSNWNTLGENSSSSEATYDSGMDTTFFPPKENNSNGFKERLEIFVSDHFQNPSFAQESYNKTVEYYKDINQYSGLPNFKLIESNLSNIENIRPSYNITYSYGDPDFGIINITHIITIQNNRLYSISYYQDKKSIQEYIPVINKMINSIVVLYTNTRYTQ